MKSSVRSCQIQWCARFSLRFNRSIERRRTRTEPYDLDVIHKDDDRILGGGNTSRSRLISNFRNSKIAADWI